MYLSVFLFILKLKAQTKEWLFQNDDTFPV